MLMHNIHSMELNTGLMFQQQHLYSSSLSFLVSASAVADASAMATTG
jgi:hypothetical protein